MTVQNDDDEIDDILNKKKDKVGADKLKPKDKDSKKSDTGEQAAASNATDWTLTRQRRKRPVRRKTKPRQSAPPWLRNAQRKPQLACKLASPRLASGSSWLCVRRQSFACALQKPRFGEAAQAESRDRAR